MATGTTVVGLFAGIGGLELGLAASGFHTELLCEIEPHAQRVLRSRFAGVAIEPDVTLLKSLPRTDILAAGFPCQDLSQAGAKVGISGQRSGLVSHLLRLVEKARPRPKWILIENVSFMLRLDKGEAMRFLTGALEALGYNWAYRVVDARSFGVPQRRLRVILLASRDEDPRDVLFVDNVADSEIISHRLQAPLTLDLQGPNVVEEKEGKSYGFYWTEGRIGIGWAVDAVPTIKGGSGIGIPSPPAIWTPATDSLGVPSIEDGERLQGFPRGWTADASSTGRALGVRWKLVGNAVCVHAAEWVGRRLKSPGKYKSTGEQEFVSGSWPLAAYGGKGKTVRSVRLSVWPLLGEGPVLSAFLDNAVTPLSHRAASGFLSRAHLSEKINYAPQFLSSVARYIKQFER
ncbi:DNA cytosine methyltransferase [Acidovorax sp.]|uniref:DNA cytosine methyltransferase n=1 Tax=Acidovorax sp. TaxID=1872122 RepID=UPI003D083E99